jgi:small subunit ribosomal protein S3
MGRKVNPIGFRLGIVSDWESNWFAERTYTDQLHEDLQIRKVIQRELTRASISKIELERSANKIDVKLHTAKPGIVIGKQGANVERLRNLLEKTFNKKVHLSIEEIKTPETDARLIAESIAEQISRRVSYRRAMKHAVQQAMRRGAKGVKIRLSGRLGGAEMSRSVVEMDGRVPLQTIRADIDYGVVHAHTTYGRIGVKVWVYRGDVLPTRKSVEPALPELVTTAD